MLKDEPAWDHELKALAEAEQITLNTFPINAAPIQDTSVHFKSLKLDGRPTSRALAQEGNQSVSFDWCVPFQWFL